MLLNSYNLTCLLSCCYNKLSVDRLDGADINYLSADAVCCELLCSLKSCAYANTRSYNTNISTLSKYSTFSNFEFIIWSVVNNRACCTSKTYVNRSYVLSCCSYASSCLDVICRAHNNHAWDCAHKSDILVALVAGAVLTYSDTSMCSTDLNIEMRITD